MEIHSVKAEKGDSHKRNRKYTHLPEISVSYLVFHFSGFLPQHSGYLYLYTENFSAVVMSDSVPLNILYVT